MEDTQSVTTLMDSTTSKIQQLQKAFAELESHRAVTLNLKWKQLEEHFHGLEKSLKRRFTELEDQEKEFETKIVQSRKMLEKRQAAVISKEQASLESLQEKRDAAVSAITIALEKHRKPYSVEPSCEVQGGPSMFEAKPLDFIPLENNNTEDHIKPFKNDVGEVKFYPELVKLCQDMDSGGLHKFISDNRKNLAAVREEIPPALRAAVDPAFLVLDSLKGFYPSEVSISDAKKDANLLGLRRTCIMLMESLSILLKTLEVDSISSLISGSVKERAKAIANEWKPKLDELDADASNGNSLEAHAFLQLLATFDINSNFNQEDLYKLIPMVSRRRQTADLCRSLGLSERMPGVIDVLVNNGRHIDAVNLAFAFELTDQFSPVSLLKSYLNEASKASSPVKSGNASPTPQNDVNEKQLTALKAVIKCIEEHKLEAQYPVDPLQKRVLQLEKEKADKKRATEVANQNNHRPASKRGGGGGGGDPTTVVQPGQVNFRLLCHVNTAGGVIGNSGGVIKNLETQTGCKIRFEDPLPNCHERVINITGDSNIDKKIGISYNNSEEVEEVVEVSRAQEGLIRVYERVLQVEGNEGGAVGCRLLAIKSQIGALMGKGGAIVDGIRKSTGAKIKVLKKDQLPACAVPEEELIQIMGRTLAVKKALVPISRRLQVCLPADRTTAHVTSEGAVREQSADFLLDTKPSIPPLQRNAVNHSSVVQSLSSDVDRVLNLDADSAQRKVVFRLLCSNDAAGGVIGKGGIIVKALEKDTGASIKFSTPIAGSKDRVATISSLESREPLYSPAQVATVRVFERSLEASRVHRHIPGVGKGGSISARILVGSSEIKCLIAEWERVSSEIGLSRGVEVQLLGAEHAPNCAAENDKVVQIVGEHDSVKSALFQLTGRLREAFFSSLVSEEAVPRNYPYSSCSHGSLHEIGTSMPSQLDHSFSSLDKMDHLGFVPNLGVPHSLLQDKQSMHRSNGKTIKESMGGWKSSQGGPESGRVDENGVAKKTIVITVSGQKFSSVYGENGSNLARLKEISGAAVVLQDPGPGECDGKVIISGSPEQIQIAQSVHQAFIFL